MLEESVTSEEEGGGHLGDSYGGCQVQSYALSLVQLLVSSW